jgi:iron complex transport system permease protein
VTAGLSSITSAVVMTRVEALNELRFWQTARSWCWAWWWRWAPAALNGLALGEDVALALG